MSTASQMPGKGKPTSGAVPPLGIDRLAAYKDVDVLCFDHDNSKDMDALMATPRGGTCRLSAPDAFSAYLQFGSMVRRFL